MKTKRKAKSSSGTQSALLTIGAALIIPFGSALANEVSEHRIEAITLSSGGLAEIRRSARVDGTAILRFDAPLEQVDDILKSIVVRDPAGTVTSMTLDGLSPVEETFRRLPFTPDEMGSLPDLLAALQGIPVRASSRGRTVEGIVLGIGTERADPDETSGPPERILSVMTDEGQVVVLKLETDTVLEILDEAMREKIREAAAVSGRGRTDDLRAIAISLAGQDERTVGLSYVVPTPVWKTAYRLMIDADENARLQAWAVIENATGEDWEDVAVTLSSGAPVTLAQHLHQRYWHERPRIPVLAQTATPPRPDSAAAMADGDAALRSGRQAMQLQAAPAPEMAASMEAALAMPTSQATAQESQVAASYRLPVPVELPAGQTLSLPFIDAELPAERIALFQPERDEIHPVSAVFITNATAASLPPGILTVYDERDGYAGDAQLLNIPVGESRMASFAADRKVEVTTERRPEGTAVQATIVDGVLRATRVSSLRTNYSIKGASDAPRTVIIEHPRREGWRFSSDALDGSTPSHHRLRVRVEAGGAAAVEALAQRSEMETFALVDADADTLLYWSDTITDTETATKLTDLAALRQQVTQAEADIRDVERDLERAAENQARIRDNLASVPGDSALGQRYVSMLEAEEDSIAELTERRRRAEERAAELRENVAAFIRGL